jgi:hypothetical protein
MQWIPWHYPWVRLVPLASLIYSFKEPSQLACIRKSGDNKEAPDELFLLCREVSWRPMHSRRKEVVRRLL